jgi:arylsulfatase A-like enzyme
VDARAAWRGFLGGLGLALLGTLGATSGLAGEEAAGTGPATPSILLVSIDTLRADHLGIYGYPRPTDPELAAATSRFARFSEAYTPLPLTVPGHVAIMSGRFPRELGVLNNRDRVLVLDGIPPLLAARLGDAGYRTAAVVASGILSRATGLDQGFGTYSQPDPNVKRGRRTADEVNAAAETLMEADEGPLFLFVHYYDAHDPYDYPELVGLELPADQKLADLLESRGLGDVQYHETLNRERDGPVIENGEPLTLVGMVASYDAGVRYATEHVAELIRLWAATPHGRGSLVLVTSDHGEGLGQHGAWSHGMNLYDESLRIPLLVRWGDGVGAGQTIEAVVSLLDLFPTILEFAGQQVPHDVPGRSLKSLAEPNGPGGREVFVAQRMRYVSSTRPARVRNWRAGDGFAVLSGEFKYVQDGREMPLLFDRSVDPGELHNIASGRPAVEKTLRDALTRWLTAFPEAAGREPAPVDEERLELLRSLGYVD